MVLSTSKTGLLEQKAGQVVDLPSPFAFATFHEEGMSVTCPTGLPNLGER